MTADEIRNSFKSIPSPSAQPIIEAQTTEGFLLLQAVLFLQETAAQLAELNTKTAFLETAARLERIASALEGLERK